MRTLCLFGMMACLLSFRLSAQDVVYLNDQTNVVGTLADITPEKVSLRVAKGESTIKFSYGADKVAAVVNQRGRFLCMNQLAGMPADERSRLISQFMTGTDSPAHDIIIRAIPSEVIYGKVSYAQGDVVNYTTLDGAPSSLPKSDLVGIFYSSGKHELFADAMFLCDKPNLLANEPTSVSAGSPKSVAKDEPVAAAPKPKQPAPANEPDSPKAAAQPAPTCCN